MDQDQLKKHLHRYLQSGRDALMWKLDGLSEYDVRRPMTRTGTNLLGLVKHVASIELGYLGDVFDRPSDIALPWLSPDAEPNADLWVQPYETRAQVVQLYRDAWAHDDATVRELDLDAVGHVEWWGEDGRVTLHQVLLHVIAETHRHAGHADIVREAIDGAAGMRSRDDNLWGPPGGWEAHRDRLEQAAREAQDAPAS